MRLASLGSARTRRISKGLRYSELAPSFKDLTEAFAGGLYEIVTIFFFYFFSCFCLFLRFSFSFFSLFLFLFLLFFYLFLFSFLFPFLFCLCNGLDGNYQ
ncbi:hypothetical protein I7I48_09303 [Histoplasma ohiense]|nr:hypothetical protein I7I48_09303 [Histoplasma ohiense (nom. inval.)]